MSERNGLGGTNGAGLQKINHKHEGIMRWLVLNPHRTQNECATELGFSPPWISRIICSDMFQAEYKRRCREANVIDAHSIRSKLGNLASAAIGHLQDQLDAPLVDHRTARDTADMALKYLGYNSPQPAAPAPVGLALIHVDGDLIVEARERARADRQPLDPIEVKPVPEPSTLLEAEYTDL